MNSFNKIILARNLNYYMDKKGIDRNKLCDDLDFKYSTVSEWLSGNKYPRIDKIEKMANYFGISKSDLIEDKSTENEKDTPTEMEREFFEKIHDLHLKPSQLNSLYEVASFASAKDAIEK